MLLGFIIYEYLNLKILALILTTILVGVTIFTFDYYIYIIMMIRKKYNLKHTLAQSIMTVLNVRNRQIDNNKKT